MQIFYYRRKYTMIKAICPVCRSHEMKFIGKPFINNIARTLLKEDYLVVRCKKCTTYYVAPEIPFTGEEWKLLYNEGYFALQTQWLIKTRKKELQQRINMLQKSAGKSKINFLDVGCGEGNALILASGKGWNTTGIDITDNRITEAKKEVISFKEGGLLELQLPAESFDIIYMDSVLEHVLNPLDYLNEIKRLLSPGGVVYIGVPNEDSLQNYVKKVIYSLTGKAAIAPQLKPFDTPYHIVGFNKKSLNIAFQKCGFKVLKMRNFGRKCEFLGFPPGAKGFYIGLFLLPFEVLGALLRRDVYYEAILTKKVPL